MEDPSTRLVSESFIKPKFVVEEANKPFYSGVFELKQMAHFYLQIGLIFDKIPSKDEGGMDVFLERLKESLSSTLVHFYPLAGQLETKVDEEQHDCFIYVNCKKGHGAKFIYATLENVTISDITSPIYVPLIVQQFFDLGRIPSNYDARDEPMLVIQVTKLVDGIVLGVSVNHAVVDGSTFWHFLYSWSEIFESNDMEISKQPIYERWFPEGYGPIVKLPYALVDELKTRCSANTGDDIVEIILHFSSQSLATLKAKANEECGMTNEISTFQTLSALLWRAIARSRSSERKEVSACVLVANLRSRLQPALSQDYFGSFIKIIIKSYRVGELQEKSLGYVALSLRQVIQDLTHERVHKDFIDYIKLPICVKPGKSKQNAILIGGLPKVDVNRLKFGVGKLVSVRAGSNKFDGKVMLRPTLQEKGGINVEVCLSRNTMLVFQRDAELLSFVS